MEIRASQTIQQAAVGTGAPRTANVADAMTAVKTASAQLSAAQGAVLARPAGLAAEAIAYAQIPLTQETLAMVETLIGNEMPIDKNTLTMLFQQMSAHPGADVEALVLMLKHDIPLTPGNLEAFAGYRNLEHRLMGELTSLIEQLPMLAGTLPQDTAAAELAEWNAKLTDILFPDAAPSEGPAVPVDGSPVPADAQSAASTVPQAVREELMLLLKDSGAPPALLTQLASDTASPKELLQELSKHLKALARQPGDAPRLIKTLLTGGAYKALLQQGLRGELLLTPGRFQKQEVGAFYEKLYDHAQRMDAELMTLQGELANSLSQSARQIGDNLQFLRDLGQSFTCLELPLLMNGEQVQGDLYVLKNKRGRKADGEGLRVLLHLELPQLGVLDVYVSLNGQQVQSNFYTGRAETAALIGEGLPALEGALRDKGFVPRTDVRERTGQEGDGGFDFVEEFLQSRGPAVERYTLDVRV